MSAWTPAPVFQEFVDVLTLAASAHALALSGIRREREFWAAAVLSPTVPETTAESTVSIGVGAPQDGDSVTYARWRLGDLPEALAEGGPMMAVISQQWAISVFTDWDVRYRKRITEAMGADKLLNLPEFGDLRHFRNDIVHHRGVASERNTGRCEVLSHWFEVGDVLYFDVWKVAEFMQRLAIAIPIQS